MESFACPFPTGKLEVVIESDAVTLKFTLDSSRGDRTGIQSLKKQLQGMNCEWLRSGTRAWLFDVASFCRWARNSTDLLRTKASWLHGTVAIVPEEVLVFDFLQVRFSIHKEEVDLLNNIKIFLSHKGADKPMVRRFHRTLRTLRYETWLDEDAMPAGTEVHRGILQGFQDSCAAVFFITPNFHDDKYLRAEINHAIEQKTAKGDRFSIITLLFSSDKGKKGTVPALLRSYVWKEPTDELDALDQIIKAMPIEPGAFQWKHGV